MSFYVYLPLTYAYCGKTFGKIKHSSILLGIQQNLLDDEVKAKLRVGRYVFKKDKMSSSCERIIVGIAK